MAMFSRRSMQRLLDDLAAQLPIEARRKLAHEINRRARSALGYEWELALLSALSHVGRVEYETSSNLGARRPDITFAETGGGSICFVADVATVSDDGLEAENPVTRFEQNLYRQKRKYDLPGTTHFDIKGEATGPTFRNRKMRLKLPKLAEMDDFFETRIGPEFRRIKSEKLTAATIAIHEPGIEFTVSYGESARYSGGGHPSFTAAYSLTRNPVYTSLKAKAQQFKKSGGTYPLGIFLCDGGCALLNNTQRSVEAVSIDMVIGEFFRQNSSVGFVAVVVFPPTRSEIFIGLVKELRITGRVYINPRTPNPLDPEALLAVINRGLANLPPPAATPRDALHWITNSEAHVGKPIGTIQYGAGIMSRSIKISARKVQELLAGKLTPAQLFSHYQRPGSKFENPFLAALQSGLTIETVTLTRLPDVDDDLLEINFGPPDPAIRKLTVK